jgi:diguanylate cyclase (GGDEF)-like protein
LISRTAAAHVLAILIGAYGAASVSQAVAQGVAETPEAALERCQEIEHGQPNEAMALAESLLARNDVIDDPVLRSRALGCLGWAQAQAGATGEARATTERLQAGLVDIPDMADRVPMLRRVAGLMNRTGRTQESIEVLSEALTLARDPALADERISLLINLAIAHSEARNHEIAIGHYQRALAEVESRPGDPRRMPVLYNLGLTLRGAGRLDEARTTMQQLVEPLQAPGMEIRLASLYSVLGAIERGLGQLDRAEDYLSLSSELHQSLDNPAEYAALLIERASVALERGRSDSAVEYARAALAEAERADFGASVRGALDVLSAALAEQGAFEEAYAVQRRFIDTSDRYWRDQLDAQLEDAEARFGNERQARELAELRQNQQQQDFALRRQELRQRLLYSAAAAVLLIGMGVFLGQRRHTRRLRRLSRTDPLTGLANRRQATEWLDALPERSSQGWTVLWLLDLDHFKRVNDDYGHNVGDLALTELSRLLERFSTNHGVQTARWGGEEFVLAGPAEDADAARRLAETLRRAVARMIVRDEQGGHSIPLTASIGYAPLFGLDRPSGQSAWEPAMQVADQLLYRAKQAGRNRSYGVWPERDGAPMQVHDLSAAVRTGHCRLLEGPAADR